MAEPAGPASARREAAAVVPLSARPVFGLPRPQPRAIGPGLQGGPRPELLGLCGGHLQLLGRLLEDDGVAQLEVSWALSRSSDALAVALAAKPGTPRHRPASVAASAVAQEPPPAASPDAHPGAARAEAKVGWTSRQTSRGSPDVSPGVARRRTPDVCCAATPDVSPDVSPGAVRAKVPNAGAHGGAFGVGQVEWDPSRRRYSDDSSADFVTRSINAALSFRSQREGAHWLVEPVKKFMEQPRVEMFWMSLILLNVVLLAVEVQYISAGLGYELGFYTEMGSQGNATLEDALSLLEYVFAVLFTIEVALRMVALQSDFWRDWKCDLDLLVILATDCSIIMATATGLDGPVDLQVIRLLRLTKLLRVLRITGSVTQFFDSASLMSAALTACLGSAAWAIIILFAALSFCALLLTSVVRHVYLGDDSDLNIDQKLQTFEYFGSYSRCMLSMFELTLANWPTIGRFLQEELHESWIVFVIFFKLTVGFAVIGVLNAVFMQETFYAVEMDNTIMVEKKRRADIAHRKKMEALFKLADRDGDGCVGPREFTRVLSNPAIRLWLASMNLDTSDGELLFELIDTSGAKDGRITVDELISGVASLRGPARSIDVKAMLKRLEGPAGKDQQRKR